MSRTLGNDGRLGSTPGGIPGATRVYETKTGPGPHRPDKQLPLLLGRVQFIFSDGEAGAALVDFNLVPSEIHRSF